MKRAILLTALLAALLAAPAAAAPVNNPLVLDTVVLGQVFWSARNVPLNCQAVDVQSADLPGREAGYGDPSTCTVTFDQEELDFRLGVIEGDWATLHERRDSFIKLCAVGVHEVGHARTLEHTVGGVMDADDPEPPWDCKLLARLVVRPTATPTATRHRKARRRAKHLRSRKPLTAV